MALPAPHINVVANRQMYSTIILPTTPNEHVAAKEFGYFLRQ